MGQYIQEGERMLFETVISVENAGRELVITNDPQNLDGLNFLTGMHLEHCNKMAEAGTRLAHLDGGVPQGRVSKRPAVSRPTSSESILSISPEWRPTRRICSHSSASPVTRLRPRPSARGSSSR